MRSGQMRRPESPRHAIRLAWISNVSAAAGSAPSSGPALSAEELFDALDGEVIKVFQRSWQVHVYSIWESDGFRWLQLSLEGSPHYTATVQLSPSDSAEEMLRRLSSWLANPAKTRHILTVA